MKKKLICLILALTFSFNSSYITNSNFTTTQVCASNGIKVNIALNNQTKGGSYTITLTDSDYNSITQVIKTSGSTAYFEDIDTNKEYVVTVTHFDTPTELWYFGKHTFTATDYGKTMYVKVADIPVENYTFTGNYTSLEGYDAKIGVAGAYANIYPATIHKGYFENYIIPDYEVVDILATFNLNGFVVGDENAIAIVDLDDYLPAFYSVVKLDSGNNNIEAIYYNTNSTPITRLNERMFSISLTDFENSCNFAIVELKQSTTPTLNFYNSVEYKYYDYTQGNTVNTANSLSTGSSIYLASNFASGGNIPTTGYISAFRNVAIGDTINLDSLNLSGVTGWYYDIIFKNQVTDTSSVVVTQDILLNGLYPKYSVTSSFNRTYSFIN